MKITVIGAGYVGLANAVLLAHHHQVTILEIDEKKVTLLNQGVLPIKDREMEKAFREERQRLRATGEKEAALIGADYVLIATPTDYDSDIGGFNTGSVEKVIGEVYRMNPEAVIVIKSTVPVGFTETISRRYEGSCILFSPEFLREGKALWDNQYPSRIVVGGPERERAVFANMMQQGALKKNIPQVLSTSAEAEAIKLFANTYLAMRVAFFNEMDSYAEVRGLETEKLIKGIGWDPRIGDYYNNPSFGYGGYCLPKDTRQLVENYEDIPQNMITAVVEANRTRKEHITAMIMKKQPEVVGVYRLAMKNDSDNYRDSAVLDIMEHLRNGGIQVILYEPMVKGEWFRCYPCVSDLNVFKKQVDLIIANRWSEELQDVAEKVYTRDVYGRD